MGTTEWIKWMEKHPVIVGLVAAAVGGLIGGLATAVFKFAEIRAASNAATEWSGVVSNWMAQQVREHENWRSRRDERLESDIREIGSKSRLALADAAAAEFASRIASETASKTKDATAEAEAELETLLSWSKKIRGAGNDTAQKVQELLVADQRLHEALAKQLGKQAPPVGAVLAWPCVIDEKHPCPPGWAECNGKWLDAGPDDPLRLALGSTYANGEAREGKVKLPNFQGMFLRGASDDGSVDPDGPRAPGKRQDDAFRRHNHEGVMQTHQGQAHRASQHNPNPDGTLGLGNTTEARGGKETRPVNYAVHWIIRVK